MTVRNVPLTGLISIHAPRAGGDNVCLYCSNHG